MKRNKYLTVLILVLFMNISCEDILDKPAPGVASEEVIKTEQGVESLLIGAYSILTGKEWFGGCIVSDWIYGSMASDEAYKGTTYGDTPTYNDIENWNVSSNNQAMRGRWLDCYNGVARTNDCLNILYDLREENNISDELATAIEAEAKFLRAWFHFKANIVFRNIPYVRTSREIDGMRPQDIPNNSSGWDEMERDLTFAIDNLDDSPRKGEVGRADRWAALAFKAKVHMYQNEFDEARPLLQEIIDKGPFELMENYYDNFHTSTNNNKESIFEIQTSVGAGVNNTLVFDKGVKHQKGPAGFGWGLFQPTQNLFNAFQTNESGLPILDVENRINLENDMGIKSSEEFKPTEHNLDPRVDYTIARRGIDFLGWGIHEGFNWIRDQGNGGPYMTKKFMHEPDEPSQDGGAFNARNFRAIRYGHILLWRAEVAVEDGDLDLARGLVNEIRNRAKQSPYVMGRVNKLTLDSQPADDEIDWNEPAANYFIEPYPSNGSIDDPFQSTDEARKAVRLEQRLEFATEGTRFFDLRRWGIIEDVLNNWVQEDSKFRSFYRGQNSSFNAPKDLYWPLPQSELDIQDALQQDPNY